MSTLLRYLIVPLLFLGKCQCQGKPTIVMHTVTIIIASQLHSLSNLDKLLQCTYIKLHCTPWMGKGGDRLVLLGDLTAFDLKHKPELRGGAFDFSR